METWSTADGSVVSSFTAPAITKAATSQRPVAPTGDGNFLVTELSARSPRGEKPITVTWTKYAPDGSVLAQGEWINPTAQAMVAGAFPGHDGGVGLTLFLSVVRGAEALKSDIDPNIGFEVGGRKIEAHVHSETRMLKINAAGNLDWVSPALDREFMWKGDVSIPDDIPMNEILQQNNEQMRLMEQTNLEYAGKRDLVHYAHHGHDEVHLTPEGYGLLADVTANRNLDPPVQGATTDLAHEYRTARTGRRLQLQLRGVRAGPGTVRADAVGLPGGSDVDGFQPVFPDPDELHERLRHAVCPMPVIALFLRFPNAVHI